MNEIPGLMYVPKNKAFLDKVLMASFYNATESLVAQVLSETSDQAEAWAVDNYVGLKKLRNQIAAELEEIDSMLEIVEARLGDI